MGRDIHVVVEYDPEGEPAFLDPRWLRADYRPRIVVFVPVLAAW